MASNGALYGVIGALGVVVVAGGAYVAQQNGAFGPITPSPSTLTPAPVTPPPLPPAASTPATPPPVAAAPPAPPSGPTAAQREQMRQLVLDARRAITRGDFASADRALDQAERIDPRSPDVVAARHDLQSARHQANRDDRRVDSLVAQARAAIARHDYAQADRLLDQAEGIDSRDRQVQQARAELNDAQRQNRSGQEPNQGRR